jgi:5-methylcytosine-specific restriction endonuclease McrA
MQMARLVLGGPSDEGRASYQIALSVCPECGNGHQQASGELVAVSAEVVAMADCDGQHLGLVPASVPVANEHPVVNDGAHTGARAKQTVTPATRRAVLRRDHGRCVVPGCRNSQFLDLHHVQPRSEAGANDADNLITLCGAHHRAAHRGELLVGGSVSRGLLFRHADGSNYGHAPEPRTAEVQSKAFAALRGLGFREGEVRRALAESCRRGDTREPSIEQVVRDAVAKLTSPHAQS